MSAPFLGDPDLEIGSSLFSDPHSDEVQDEGSSLAVPGQRSSSFSSQLIVPILFHFQPEGQKEDI